MGKKMATYNDGYLIVYKPPDTASSFGAPVNARDVKNMELVVALSYSERSRRAQDMEWAQANDISLSLKVCTPLYEVSTACRVAISGTLYSIANVDYDRGNRQMFLYLEEVGKVA